MSFAIVLAAVTILGGLALGLDHRAWRRGRRAVESSFARAETSRGRVPYLDVGPRDGPVVLFSSGGGAGPDLVYAMPWFAAAGYRVIASCRPGYYDVPIDEHDDLGTHAELHAEVLASLGITEPVHVVGVSAGGAAALFFAARFPTRSLTLWCPVTGSYRPQRAAMESLLGRLVLSRRGQALSSWMLGRSARWFPRTTMAAFLRTESSLGRTQIRAVVEHSLARPGGRERFRAFVDATTPMSRLYTGMMDELEKLGGDWTVPWEDIEAPVLAVASPVDADVTSEHIERLKRHLPDARILEPQAGGHFVWWGSDGEAVVQETLDHIARASRGPS